MRDFPPRERAVPELNSTSIMLFALVSVAGCSGGLLAGLLGVGGGLVIVPLLEMAFTGAQVDRAVTMHLAVATSMATIVPTSIASSRAHARRGALDQGTVRAWAPWIVAGALTGAFAAAYLDGRILAAVFGVLALGVAARMLFAQRARSVAARALRRTAAPLPFGIGFVSALLGIGGGTLSVPVLAMRGLSMHSAVGTAARLGLWISAPATVGFMLARPPPGAVPPFSIGYVSLPAFAIVGVLTWYVAPWGARLAHRVSQQLLTRAFAIFLLAVALRMFLRAYPG